MGEEGGSVSRDRRSVNSVLVSVYVKKRHPGTSWSTQVYSRQRQKALLSVSGHASPLPQILISADDEMEESDVEEDLCRLTPLKPGKKKKHRFGLPV